MYPEQNQSGPPANNQYDFITNPQQPKKSPFGGGGDSLMKRVMIVCGGLVVLMILAGIIISILSSGGQGPTQAMKDLVLEQQDIILTSANGASEAIDPSMRALAITTELSVGTDQTNLNNYLSKIGKAVDSKLIPKKLNTNTAATLDAARASNRYDETFGELIRNKLVQYQLNLKSAYEASSSEDAKATLTEAYSSATNLLGPPVAAE